MEKQGSGRVGIQTSPRDRSIPGIVIAAGREVVRSEGEPRIAAFIWGGKVRPVPTLPYGRWKGAA